MQRSWIRILACFVPLWVLAGCQRGGDGTSPTAAAVGGEGSPASADAAAANKSTQDPLHPVVVIDTSVGKLTIQLDAENRRLTVDNFLTYVNSHHYDGTIFHQVLKDYPRVIIGGAFTPELVEKKALTPIRNEADSRLKNVRGTIGMARRADDADSATCHFYINLGDNEVLDYTDRTAEGYGYCVFGKVIDGLPVAETISQTPVRNTDKFERLPVETIAVRSVQRIK